MTSIDLSHNQIVSIAVNLSIFVVILVASVILISKLKLQDKGYKYLFVLYTIFWIPIMLVRPYRGTMQNAIGDTEFVWIVTAAYGFVGIFMRIFADWISYIFKYRKAFLYFCVVAQIGLFIPILVNPNTTSNILQACAIGIGASCIGSYELLFKEQYGNKKAFLTVSILSIPPLLANFLTAPIQSIVKTAATVNKVVDPNILVIMWIIAFCFLVIAFIMLFFLKEVRRQTLFNKKDIDYLHPKYAQQNQQLIFFIGLAFIGSLIAFIKFSNSDSVATSHIQQLAKYNNTSSAAYEGYLSVVFSLFQLVAGVLVGTILIRKMSISKIFVIGSIVWITYEISAAFIRNPIAYICIHGLNGFAYGIIYNLILAIVLRLSSSKKVITKMGWYQSILAIGITASGWFTPWLKSQLMANNDSFDSYMHVYMIENLILLGAIILSTIIFILIVWQFNKSDTNFKMSDSQNSKTNQVIEKKKEVVDVKMA